MSSGASKTPISEADAAVCRFGSRSHGMALAWPLAARASLDLEFEIGRRLGGLGVPFSRQPKA